MHQNSSLFYVFSQEDFELSSDRDHQDFIFNLLLVLLLPIQTLLFEKSDDQKNSIIALRAGCGKIIFLLLD